MPKIVTIICPICGKEIEIHEYNKVTRSDALGAHLKKEHRSPQHLPQTITRGDDDMLKYYKVPPSAF